MSNSTSQLPAWSPEAKPGQAILLQDLNYDVLSLIVNAVYDIDTSSSKSYFYSVVMFKIGRPIKNLSLTSKFMRSLCVPKLFRGLRQSAAHTSVVQALQEFSPEILAYAKRFKFCLYDDVPNGLTPALVDALSKMSGLSKLTLSRHSSSTKCKAISDLCMVVKTKKKLFMPTVKHLILSADAKLDYMVAACPNIESLEVSGYPRTRPTLAAGAKLKNLRHVRLTDSSGWKRQYIDEIRKLIPRVEALTIDGEIDNTRTSRFAEKIAKFRNLKRLMMTTTQKIYVPFPLSEAFEVGSGAGSYIFEMQFDHPQNEEPNQVAMEFFTRCPQLEVLGLVFPQWELQVFHPVRDSSGELVGVDEPGEILEKYDLTALDL